MTTIETPSLDSDFRDIPLKHICLQHNIRRDVELDDDFVASIQEQGILVRTTVQTGPCEHDLPFIMVAGHRRASALAWITGDPEAKVPAEVIDQGEAERIIYMLSENMQRHSLGPIDEGQAFRELITMGMTQALLAQSVGKSSSYVSERIALTALPEEAQEYVRGGQLTLELALRLARTNNDRIIGGVLKRMDGYSRPDAVRYVIDDVENKVGRTMAAEKLVRDLKKQGWNVGTAKPKKDTLTGNVAAVVALKDLRKGFGITPGLALDLTVSQFAKRPDAYAQVSEGWNEPKITYWTLDRGRYDLADQHLLAVIQPESPEAASPAGREASKDRRDAVEDARTGWVIAWFKAKKALPQAQVAALYLHAEIERVMNDDPYLLARLLCTPEECEDKQWRETRALIEPKLLALSASERFKLLLAVRLDEQSHDGNSYYDDDCFVPDLYVQAGYEPSELEQGWPTEADFHAGPDEEDEEQELPGENLDDDQEEADEDTEVSATPLAS